jgi:hypothetical protein
VLVWIPLVAALFAFTLKEGKIISTLEPVEKVAQT